MPNQPTLLRQFTPSKPSLSEVVSGNIRAEAARQRITRADLKRSLGWSEHKMRSLWEGRRMLLTDVFLIGPALGVDSLEFFAKADEETPSPASD